MRKDTREELSLEAHAEGDELVAHVDAIDAHDHFLNDLTGQLRVKHVSAREPVSVPLRQTAPGYYEARLPLTQFGSFVLDAVLSRDGRPVISAHGNFAHPFPSELAELSPLPDLLAEAALRTGGGAPARGAALFQAGLRKLTFPRERWPWFAWLAACLFVLDIAARRLAVPTSSRRPHACPRGIAIAPTTIPASNGLGAGKLVSSPEPALGAVGGLDGLIRRLILSGSQKRDLGGLQHEHEEVRSAKEV
jgi:hypothetical protein